MFGLVLVAKSDLRTTEPTEKLDAHYQRQVLDPGHELWPIMMPARGLTHAESKS
jgi:hypothetical protein